MRGTLCALAVAGAVAAPAAARAGAITIDFEGKAEFTPVGDLYAPMGVTFGIDGAPGMRPIISVTGPAASAFGGPPGSIIDGPMKSGMGGLTDPVGASVTEARDIVMLFAAPASEVSFWMLDVDRGADWRDEATVRAYGEGGSLLETLTVRAGDAGTGDGVATLVALRSEGIVRVVVDVLPVMGYALDDVSFTLIPGPGAGAIGALGLVAAGRRRKR